jgi:hypothetical protein
MKLSELSVGDIINFYYGSDNYFNGNYKIYSISSDRVWVENPTNVNNKITVMFGENDLQNIKLINHLKESI